MRVKIKIKFWLALRVEVVLRVLLWVPKRVLGRVCAELWISFNFYDVVDMHRSSSLFRSQTANLIVCSALVVLWVCGVTLSFWVWSSNSLCQSLECYQSPFHDLGYPQYVDGKPIFFWFLRSFILCECIRSVLPMYSLLQVLQLIL